MEAPYEIVNTSNLLASTNSSADMHRMVAPDLCGASTLRQLPASREPSPPSPQLTCASILPFAIIPFVNWLARVHGF